MRQWQVCNKLRSVRVNQPMTPRLIIALCGLLILTAFQPVYGQAKKKTKTKVETRTPSKSDTIGVVNGVVITLGEYKSVLGGIVRQAARDSVVSEENLGTYF